ncbi:MAG: DUF2306 domain-containing protein [Rhodosalinus sp.]
MAFDVLTATPLIVQLHLAAALPALLLGPVALYRRRRDRLHKTFGYLWVASILGLAVSGLFIRSEIALLGPFGPIHLFSVFAIYGVADGVWCIRRGDARGHLVAMQSVWFGAVGLAGLLTLLPGRTLNRALFGDAWALGAVAAALGLAGLALLWRRRFRAPPMRGG